MVFRCSEDESLLIRIKFLCSLLSEKLICFWFLQTFQPLNTMSLSLPTPTISFQAPPGNLLYTYKLPLSSSQQPSTIPSTFLDCASVRETVFVHEQRAVPLKHHLDRDDARSCHWVLNLEQSTESKARPIGAVRLVPYPHHPHPEPGARFEAPSEESPESDPQILFSSAVPRYAVDRATDLHDGVEPYLKLGRLCVVAEERGNKYADILIQEALRWARENPWFAQEALGVEREVPEWKGLVCVHAQENAVGTWRRNGFVVDEGMFRREDLGDK